MKEDIILDKVTENNYSFFRIDKDVKFHFHGRIPVSVNHALSMLFRDMSKVFGGSYKITESPSDCDIFVRYADSNNTMLNSPESFCLKFEVNDDKKKMSMIIEGIDDLGLIYGLLYISTIFLGVDPFWFWAEKEPEKKVFIDVPAKNYVSKLHYVRYRGWFINDEVCLLGWTDTFPPQKEVWYPAFEALLRCGGNMIIPGIDAPEEVIQWDLASEMGLYLTQHHVIPMGAKMFTRVYPDKRASYDENKDLFVKLWLEAIEKNKDKKHIWVLGFRGQGDCPFWTQDEGYDTPERQGELISRVIKDQYEFLIKHLGDTQCATYLYGDV